MLQRKIKEKWNMKLDGIYSLDIIFENLPT
jgi:hypothetical protein